MVAEHHEPSAPRASETRTDEAQRTEDVFLGVVFVLLMYVCLFLKEMKRKTDALFFLS